ncbi:MAG: tRNA dihydrouridine synthase DusB [Vicinamibacterales bacterium]|jgi:nifR3 family TIM-barrel protein|nr:tRNA dihydrouridine synthase DusB [Vicinamibacterales bacterium]
MGIAPMAGMTDSAFRRMVKRLGSCGLVVSEMVSSEALVRGIGRSLEYLEFTEEERPVSIQIFGGDPSRMAAAAQVVESRGADVVDVNMGCPVPKIAKHHAGCSLMREPDHAASIVAAMVRAVRIPVTVKMRAGWNDQQVNAPELARMVEAAGASAVAVHGRTAAQAYHGLADWNLIARVAEAVQIPVYGCGDLVEPGEILDRLRSTPVAGVLVGRGILRNPWLFAQAADLMAGRRPREVSLEDRRRFLIDYIDLLVREAPWGEEDLRQRGDAIPRKRYDPAATHDRWVVNKLRALCGYYTKGVDGGAHLRVAVNQAPSVGALRTLIEEFFGELAPSA